MPLQSSDRLLLRPSKLKTSLFLLVSLTFVGMDIFVVSKGGGLAGWLVLVFFGTCTLVFAAQFLPGCSYLLLTADGFVACSLFRKWPPIAWIDVSEFRVATIRPSHLSLVVFDWAKAPNPLLRKMNRTLVGAGEGLPDVHGLRPELA